MHQLILCWICCGRTLAAQIIINVLFKSTKQCSSKKCCRQSYSVNRSKTLPSFLRDLPELGSVWPDWAIYWTLGNFSKPVATISLPKSLTFLGNICKGVTIFNFCSEIIFGQFLETFGDFLLVTLLGIP